jgi:hypothetical protein
MIPPRVARPVIKRASELPYRDGLIPVGELGKYIERYNISSGFI